MTTISELEAEILKTKEIISDRVQQLYMYGLNYGASSILVIKANEALREANAKLKQLEKQLKEKQETMTSNVTYTYVTPKNAPVSKAEVAGGLVLTVGESRKNNALKFVVVPTGLGVTLAHSCSPEEAVFIKDNSGSMIRVFPDQIPSLLDALATMLDRGVSTIADESYKNTQNYNRNN